MVERCFVSESAATLPQQVARQHVETVQGLAPVGEGDRDLVRQR